MKKYKTGMSSFLLVVKMKVLFNYKCIIIKRVRLITIKTQQGNGIHKHKKLFKPEVIYYD